jgi:hypothetical protein
MSLLLNYFYYICGKYISYKSELILRVLLYVLNY